MPLLKGVMILGGAMLGAAAAAATGPLLVVSAPFLGVFGATTYSVSALGAAGVSAGIAPGLAFGRVAGETGSALVIQGMSSASESLMEKLNRKIRRDYDKALYKSRHLIENFFCKLKNYRAIATRYDKTARIFLSALYLAAAVLWLN